MEQDSGHFLKTATALKIWQEDDVAGEASMYKCLLLEKDGFFRRVIYKNGKIHEDVLNDIAETAFTDAWLDIRRRAKGGQLVIKEATVIGYFYITFRNSYLRLVDQEEKRKKKEKDSADGKPTVGHNTKEENDALKAKIQIVFGKMGKVCRELLGWRYDDDLSIDDIADLKKGEIKRENVIKMLSRCRKQFLTIWNDLK
jgi:hypothetical protein